MGTFLNAAEMKTLTGKTFKSHQISQLRKMGIPFWVNGTGHAIVARSVIDGKNSVVPEAKPTWVPRVLRAA